MEGHQGLSRVVDILIKRYREFQALNLNIFPSP